VEECYLQEFPESSIIREQSRSNSRDDQLTALEYIGDAIKKGNTGDEILGALESMGIKGPNNVIRENGRVVNNFPDVRAKTAIYLGEIGTAGARESLIKMLMTDNETMVLIEVIKSLAKIGIDKNDEIAVALAWIIERDDRVNPDNSLTLEALDSFAQRNKGIRDLTCNNGIESPVFRIAAFCIHCQGDFSGLWRQIYRL
jgi:hypothetical protein